MRLKMFNHLKYSTELHLTRRESRLLCLILFAVVLLKHSACKWVLTHDPQRVSLAYFEPALLKEPLNSVVG